jgi:hypothetical protein
MSAGQYRDAFEKKQNRKKFINQWQVVKDGLFNIIDVCEDVYNENLSEERKLLDDKYDEKRIERECTFNNEIEDTFHQNLDEIRNEFLDKYDNLSASEMALIYQYTEFIKSKC